MLIAVLADAPRETVLLGNAGQPHDPPVPCLTLAEALVLRVVEFAQGVLTSEDQQPHVTGNIAKGVAFLPTAPFNGVTLLLLLGLTLLPEMLLDEAASVNIGVVDSAINRGAKRACRPYDGSDPIARI